MDPLISVSMAFVTASGVMVVNPHVTHKVTALAVCRGTDRDRR